MRVESRTFNGIIFRRYPEAKDWSSRNYFRPSQVHGRKRVESLHREVWKKYHGAIPKGYDVHHADDDTGNNDITNLELLPGPIHDSLSGKKASHDFEHLARIRPLAKAWHASPEGLDWHRDHGKEAMQKRKAVGFICQNCGAHFLSKQRGECAKFCSNKCKSAARRKSGVDDVPKICATCSETFLANKYQRILNCPKCR
jgi:hypothetical protein